MIVLLYFAPIFNFKENQGTRSPENCHFPFKYDGKEYFSCTTVADPSKRPWCAVEVDSNGNAGGKWGHCDPTSCSAGSSGLTKSSPGSNLNSRSRACQTVSHIEIAKDLFGTLTACS